MKIILKTTIYLLTVALIVGVFAACTSSSNNNRTNNTTNAVTKAPDVTTGAEDKNEKYVLPNEDLDGYEMRIFSIMGPVTTWLTFPFFTTEESETKIASAVYNRNLKIEDSLKCSIVEDNADNYDGELWVNLLADDTDEYQCGTDYSWNSISRACDNMLIDFKSVSTINLDKPWWDQNLNAAYEINNHVFITSGSAMTSSWDEIFVIYFNSTIAENINPDMNLYQIVRDGKWTLDKFCELIIAGDNNLNNPGEEDDSYGLVTQAFYSIPSFLGGNKVTYGIVNSDNKIENYTANPKFLNTAQKLAEKLFASESIYYGDDEGDDIFKDGKSLFLNQCIGDMTRMRDLSEFDYGILPMPKFDENVDKYYSYSGAQYLLFIPWTNLNIDKTGIILDAMMGLSEYSLKEIYIEDMLGQIYSRTPDAAEMLTEYVLPNTLYDIGGRSGLQFNSLIPLDKAIPLGITELASMIDGVTDAIQAKIENVNNYNG